MCAASKAWPPGDGVIVDSTTSGAAFERDTVWIRIRRQPPLAQAALALAVVALLAVAAWLLYPRAPATPPARPRTPVGVLGGTAHPATRTAAAPRRGDRRHRATCDAHRRASGPHITLRDFRRAPAGRWHHPGSSVH